MECLKLLYIPNDLGYVIEKLIIIINNKKEVLCHLMLEIKVFRRNLKDSLE